MNALAQATDHSHVDIDEGSAARVGDISASHPSVQQTLSS